MRAVLWSLRQAPVTEVGRHPAGFSRRHYVCDPTTDPSVSDVGDQFFILKTPDDVTHKW